jgi:hypothetical protein
MMIGRYWPATRWQAFRVHLTASFTIGGLFALATYFLWYPQPLLALQGGLLVMGILLGVDVVLGPLMTLLVFSPRKPRRELRLDLAVIVTVQLAAFMYGGWVVYSERPQYLVFAHSQFFVVRGPESLGFPDDSVLEKSPRYGVIGPRVVYAVIPAEHVANGSALLAAVFGDPTFALDATAYRPYPHNLGNLQSEALDAKEILPELGEAPGRLAQSMGIAVGDLSFFQIKGRTSSGVVVLRQQKGELLDILDVDLRRERKPISTPDAGERS